jgi:hypothetical protein
MMMMMMKGGGEQDDNDDEKRGNDQYEQALYDLDTHFEQVDDMTQQLVGEHVGFFLLISYLVLPPASRIQLQALDCVELKGSGRFLRVDTSIDCDSSSYASFVHLDYVLLACFLSIPLVWGALLWSKRRQLNPGAFPPLPPSAAEVSRRRTRSEAAMVEHDRIRSMSGSGSSGGGSSGGNGRRWCGGGGGGWVQWCKAFFGLDGRGRSSSRRFSRRTTRLSSSGSLPSSSFSFRPAMFNADIGGIGNSHINGGGVEQEWIKAEDREVVLLAERDSNPSLKPYKFLFDVYSIDFFWFECLEM